MQILGLLDLYFDAVVVKVKIFFFTFIQIGSGHSVAVEFGSNYFMFYQVKFTFSKKATKIDKIFTVDLTLCGKSQIEGEDFVHFCGLLGKNKLYLMGNYSQFDPNLKYFLFEM